MLRGQEGRYVKDLQTQAPSTSTQNIGSYGSLELAPTLQNAPGVLAGSQGWLLRAHNRTQELCKWFGLPLNEVREDALSVSGCFLGAATFLVQTRACSKCCIAADACRSVKGAFRLLICTRHGDSCAHAPGAIHAHMQTAGMQTVCKAQPRTRSLACVRWEPPLDWAGLGLLSLVPC